MSNITKHCKNMISLFQNQLFAFSYVEIVKKLLRPGGRCLLETMMYDADAVKGDLASYFIVFLGLINDM